MGGTARAVGTFCLAKKDVSGENKGGRNGERKRDLLAEEECGGRG